MNRAVALALALCVACSHRSEIHEQFHLAQQVETHAGAHVEARTEQRTEARAEEAHEAETVTRSEPVRITTVVEEPLPTPTGEAPRMRRTTRTVERGAVVRTRDEGFRRVEEQHGAIATEVRSTATASSTTATTVDAKVDRKSETRAGPPWGLWLVLLPAAVAAGLLALCKLRPRWLPFLALLLLARCGQDGTVAAEVDQLARTPFLVAIDGDHCLRISCSADAKAYAIDDTVHSFGADGLTAGVERKVCPPGPTRALVIESAALDCVCRYRILAGGPP